jgi:glycosyltransferase involved in cell wall biosynthesis
MAKRKRTPSRKPRGAKPSRTPPKKAGSGAKAKKARAAKPSRTPPKKARAAKSKKARAARPSRAPARKARIKPAASKKPRQAARSQTDTPAPPYSSYGYGASSGLPSAGELSAASYGRSSPAPVRPLRVTHVGQSMLRAGIENWLKDLVRFLDRRRVQMVKCIATIASEIDPSVVAEMGVPVEVGGADSVRRAARDSDVLLCWGPPELGQWLVDMPPKLCVFVAHGEGWWTRHLLDGCKPVDHVIAVSRRAKDRVADGLPTTIIPNGVDLARLARTRPAAAVREELGFHADDFVLGYVGRFSEEKRAHLLIDAVARLPASFKALFVGWGYLGSRLLEHANARIPGRYAFVKATNDVGDYYAALDALCLPSSQEGFGLVILEAMLCERPIIATQVGCVPDMIVDRVNGLVVDGAPESIRDAALLLHDNPAWARGLAAQGRADAEARGQARTMARAYEDLLLGLWNQKFGGLNGNGNGRAHS